MGATEPHVVVAVPAGNERDCIVEGLARRGISATLLVKSVSELPADSNHSVIFALASDPALMQLCDSMSVTVGAEHRVVVVIADGEQWPSLRANVEKYACDVILRPFSAADVEARLVVVMRRLTERAKFFDLLGQLPDFVLSVDVEGKIRFINRAGPAGTPEQIKGDLATDHLPEDQHVRFTEAFERARVTGEMQMYEADSYGLPWQVRVTPVLDGDQFVGATLIATDITERRRASAELEASEMKARAILGALPDMVFRMSSDGEYLAVNAPDPDLLVLPPDQIVGRRVTDILPEEVAARTLEELAAALRTREVRVFEYELPDEHRKWFEARMIAVGPDEVIVLVRDMTDRRHMEAQLGIADRLAALGTLAAGVAHEVNNPLTYVLIGVDAVARELRALGQEGVLGDRLPNVLKRLDDALEGARRVRQIVGDLRGFSRVDEENLRSVDVVETINSVLSMADSHVRYRATVVKEYGDMPNVRADSDRLNQVFLNLLLNAVQSLPESNTEKNVITISTGQDAQGRAVIAIRDTGCGIKEESLERIFDPFFTSKPVGVGTGLGLWICHNIITRYGGDISVSSTPGAGSTFTVVLPAAPPEAADTSEGSSGELTIGLPEDARIIVVDNEPQVGEALRILLSDFSIDVVGDGRTAVERICRDEPYDLVLCDLMMPGLSGMDVYEQVRVSAPGRERSFVFMTGGAFTQRARAFLSSVDNPCVTKPFREEPMRAAIRDRVRQSSD